jgi:hypothetical protein
LGCSRTSTTSSGAATSSPTSPNKWCSTGVLKKIPNAEPEKNPVTGTFRHHLPNKGDIEVTYTYERENDDLKITIG